jgi:GT2 family glycosyltransferase
MQPANSWDICLVAATASYTSNDIDPSPMKFSIVIAASNSAADVRACLASLKGQGEADDTEIIVVANLQEPLTEPVLSDFRHVQLAQLSPHTTVPELRAHGMTLSQGDVVALLEDNCTVDANWCAELRKAHESPYFIVGGAVERRWDARSVDWAVYFYEYGKYMLPLTSGETDSLPGNNVSYKRSLLTAFKKHYRDGLFEAFLHQELRACGYRLHLAPAAIVYHTTHYQAGTVLAQCFHHGRHFAGRRTIHASGVTRLAFAAGSLLLALILPFRITRLVVTKQRHLRQLWRSLPYLVLFMASWACGECCGYLLGEGDSAKRWV